MTHQFDLNKPSHLIANDVLRQLEILMSGSGLHVMFGTQAHDLIDGLIAQYQDKLMEANNKSVNTLRDRMIAQAQNDDEQEAWLRERLKALRFPIVEDVYVSTAYSFYVTFERLLTADEISRAIGVNLEIERTFPLKNRYRVVFLAPDVEEA
jgi:hypothetical protein